MRMTGRTLGLGLALALSAPCPPVLAQGLAQGQAAPNPPADLASLAAKFGAREAVRSISLSPDGKHLALVSNLSSGDEALSIVNVETGEQPKPIMRSAGSEAHMTSCFWPTDTRLVCEMHYIDVSTSILLGVTRMFSINADGTDIKRLTANSNGRSLYAAQFGGEVIDQTGGDTQGSVLMMRDYVPERTTGTILGSEQTGLGVERIDVTTIKRSTVENARADAIDYISDGLGNVRLYAAQPHTPDGYDRPMINWYYRKAGSRDWSTLNRVDITPSGRIGFQPAAVDPALNVAYGFEGKDGMSALYRVKLDGSMAKELVLARQDVDVDTLLRIGRQRRVVGASYATDRREVVFFDPQLKSLGTALGKAIPGSPMIGFLDASADENRLLMIASADTNPGMLYLFNKAQRKLDEVMPVRPELVDVPLATMKPVMFTARDGSQVPAYLTLPVGGKDKGLPAIVMPHGGPSARDEWGFDWLAQFFAARGFAVLQPNFRGSAGYGMGWFRKNGFQSWKEAIGDVDDAGKWLVKEGIADAGKLAIVGWSYGGYAALQTGVFDPGQYKAIVAIAPVTDLAGLVNASREFTDYNLVHDMIGSGPHVREGSPAANAGKITAPVLMFHGTWDLNVPILQSRTMQDRLKDAGKPVELVEFPKLDHQLDDATARTAMLTRIDTFLHKSMGM